MSWPGDVVADYSRLVELLREYGLELGLPHARPIGGGLFELRARGRDGIARAFYCFARGRRVMILHAFVKKTQKTPLQELRIARRRQREVRDG
ncbi:MAG: type II toxin-antitoxin system RelE/ParE family toxin [Chloroflexota bacterium]